MFITISVTYIFLVPAIVYYTVFDSNTFVGISIMSSFFYALIRPYSIEKYLKQSLEQAVIEFETVKKIIPLLFLILLMVELGFYSIPHTIGDPSPPPFYIAVAASSGILTGIGIAGLLMYGLIILKKEFRFYFAKTCFISAINKKDTFRQMYYYGIGIKEYNRYLKTHLKRQIKDIDKIFSTVSLLDNDAKTEVFRSLSYSFETESDKLTPLRYISSEPILMKSEDIESVLIPESLKSHLKVVGTLLAASIPIVISIITLYMTITTPHK